MIIAIGFILLGFALMELSGWAIHKYLMHGPLWMIHKTHHEPSKHAFELNDLFSLLFGSIAVILIFLGISELDYRFWIGIGISLYGLLYFILHDVLIHRRIKWFERPKSLFLRGIFKAHQAHHRSNKKDDAVSFGLFVVPKEYFKEEEK
ncbi:sterol desaturase family protein [Algoriphagus machipongonensis]|uniref:Beta-carotene hydroxylase n=1 Tax=Algoriphagus machipongonensis TaxID=388413 RepID=A3HUA6_9BACT|nr:sterol desaturase family protein [Algoriphagus machipongonensis]EAZ81728.1 beta-carotene hydroxylase [Algoriphagus machipongonensis]